MDESVQLGNCIQLFVWNSGDIKIDILIRASYFQVETKSIVVSKNEITEQIIGAAIKVHKDLGPGLLESVYESCLYSEILNSGLYVERQKPIPVIYKDVKLECGFRADLVIEREVVVEVESVESLDKVHFMQILTHLRLLDLRVGLLMNFNVVRLKQGLKRVVNNFRETS